MTRGKGIYDDEHGSEKSASSTANSESDKDVDEKTPDVDKDSGEPTA
ncbi:hypothetical protein [Mycolicibacterium duvalii]|uniref:Uncharacterized protein n=1 Tax=Mycolicibacterium duvalii TaxID=39688 RepID=A0A7I7K8T3_9MYCO|nr:hypothetical protein [Mycolicibacterium duvalii]MCV7368253.1 hypothetical protein [Mycolicibacterium duvalii]BBX19911.1 hypothetical protein MDUV_47710 [Mycolicibacterium duvalii]